MVKYHYTRKLTVDNNLPLQEIKKEFAKIGVVLNEDSSLNLIMHLLKPQVKDVMKNVLDGGSRNIVGAVL